MNLALDQTLNRTELRVRVFRDSDALQVCSWVATREALQLVSGDIGDQLTPQMLQTWRTNATASFVVSQGARDEPIGFCTISRREVVNLPPQYIEICHLIVDPSHRHRFIGSLLIGAARSAASTLGFLFLCGRIVSTNRWALALAQSQRAKEFTDSEGWASSGFRWFRLNLY